MGPYEIVELVGKGGMGEVYRAQDTRLDRSVAIKVLPERLSKDENYRRRLEREAKTISQLQHPHVCMLHDVGFSDVDEALSYLVMEYLEGETLEDRLDHGPLSLDEALRIGREIAEAMEAAHRRGIVHRDLKPGNVMLTEHGTKVLDFGLAKGIEDALVDAGTDAPTRTRAITQEGALVGTVPYMAPEQLEGKPADARTDLWALGCLIYEMASGERPFQGETQASLITSIMSAKPDPVSQRQPVAPERLDRIVERCLEKDPERRWQSAQDVALELEAIDRNTAATDVTSDASESAAESAGRPRTKRGPLRRTLLPAALVVILVGFVLWVLSKNPRGSVDEELVGGDELRTNIVLPFENVGGDPELEALAIGIWDELSIRLAGRGHPVDREVLVEFRGHDPCEAARELRAHWVYAGSVRRAGSTVRINAQLWDCPDGREIWRDTYDRDIVDQLAAQDDIVSRILMTSQDSKDLSSYFSRPGSIGWLIGQRTREANLEARQLLREAVEREPASFQLPVTMVSASMQTLLQGWAEEPALVIAEMRQAAQKCLDLQPQQSVCQWAVGHAELFSGDGEKMVTAFRRLLELEGEPDDRVFLGMALAIRGRPDEAVPLIEEALRLSPEDVTVPNWLSHLAIAHFTARRYGEARDRAEKCVGFNTNDPWGVLPRCYQLLAASLAYLGEEEAARAALRRALQEQPALTVEVALFPYASSSPEQREHLAQGLRMAGLD